MEHKEHKWGEWKKVLYYTSEGRFTGEVRKCEGCSAVEARNLEVEERPAVINPTIGGFVGFFDRESRILLKQIETGKLAGEWDLPGGGIRAVYISEIPNEWALAREVSRRVQEEVGMFVPFSSRLRITPVMLAGGGDIAFLFSAFMTSDKPTKGVTRYFSLDEIGELVDKPPGERLVGGRGKRMHRLVLLAFERGCPVMRDCRRAGEILDKIYQTQAVEK